MCKGKKLIVLAGLICLGSTGFCQSQQSGTKSKMEKANAQVTKVTTSIQQGAAPEVKALLGKYNLYAGIPAMYLGHVVLMADGKYKVAFSTDESDYETGTYTYHADTNSIEWLSGLAKRKDWSGKLIKKPGGYRIEFSKSTYAEN